MEEPGFEDVRKEEVPCDIRLAKYYQDMQFMVMEEQAAAQATAEGKEKVERAIEDGVRESRGRARVTPKMVWATPGITRNINPDGSLEHMLA
ncbi:MAG: hypothetical protein Q9166_004625 [cf. Caloplaca sp. 2 TL-2023]